jgi:hypothetical protein
VANGFACFVQPSEEGRLRLWVEKGRKEITGTPRSHPPQSLAVMEFESAMYASLLKTHAVKLVFCALKNSVKCHKPCCQENSVFNCQIPCLGSFFLRALTFSFGCWPNRMEETDALVSPMIGCTIW